MTVPGERRTGVAVAAPPGTPGRRVSLRRLMRVSAVACGVQFGWALQLSLLTPYVQELGIPHAWASLVWLCGPLSGLVVQPLVGHLSDRTGRRRPFVAAGAAGIAVAVLLIGYSTDLGRLLGDSPEGQRRPRAIAIFVLAFWILDLGNNATQAPARALLADLTGKDHRRKRVANAYFSFFMALGNVLGFATGSYSGWFTIFPFTVTSSCGMNCANLKSAFLLDIVLLAFTTYICISVKEAPLSSGGGTTICVQEAQHQLTYGEEAFLWELMSTFRYLSSPVLMILIVTALTWVGWFPFFLFDTDWMGREIYRGKPNEGQIYHSGVRMGAFGLMLNSVVLGFTSVVLEKLCRKWGAGFVWGLSNILMSFCFGSMLIISFMAKYMEFPWSGLPPDGIIITALVIFAVLGAPLAVTYIIPYAMISTRAESLGLGQGLAMGILNLAIVVPQVFVSLGSGPWDQLFGGGNSPAFAVAAVASFVSGVVAVIALPRSYIAKRRDQK